MGRFGYELAEERVDYDERPVSYVRPKPKRTKRIEKRSAIKRPRRVLERSSSREPVVIVKHCYDEPRKSLARAARELIVTRPELSAADIVKKLVGMGYQTSVTTIGTLRFDTRATVRVLSELKMLRSKFDFDA